MVYCCSLCGYFSSKKKLLFISLQPHIAKVNTANSFNLSSQALFHKSVLTPCVPSSSLEKTLLHSSAYTGTQSLALAPLVPRHYFLLHATFDLPLKRYFN